MRGNPGLDLAYTCERAVPSQLQFRRDQQVLRIDGVVLAECPIGAVARRLEVAHQRITNLIAAAGRLCFGLDCRSYRSRLDNPQKSFLDGVVGPQSSECDAAGPAISERTPPTGIARNVMLGACVADRQLASRRPSPSWASPLSAAKLVGANSKSNGSPGGTACRQSCKPSNRNCDGACISRFPSREDGCSRSSPATSTTTRCRQTVRHCPRSYSTLPISGGERCSGGAKKMG